VNAGQMETLPPGVEIRQVLPTGKLSVYDVPWNQTFVIPVIKRDGKDVELPAVPRCKLPDRISVPTIYPPEREAFSMDELMNAPLDRPEWGAIQYLRGPYVGAFRVLYR
jgi:hypothetical protein